MPGQPTDADIIQDAYAERLKVLFDNYVDGALSDPDGAKTKFATGVSFLRNLRASALQALPAESVPVGAMAARTSVSPTSSSRKKTT